MIERVGGFELESFLKKDLKYTFQLRPIFLGLNCCDKYIISSVENLDMHWVLVINLRLVNLVQFDHFNRIVPLTMITISIANCISE